VLATGAVLDRVDLAVHPWLVLAFLAVTAAVAFQVREAPRQAHPQDASTLRARLSEPRVRWFFASVVLMIFAHGALYSYLSLHLVQLGYSKSAVGALWVLGVVAEIAVFYTQGRWFRRWGIYSLLAASFAAAVLRFLLIAWCAEILWLLVIAQLLHGMTFAVHHSASILTVQRWFSGPAAARGQALYVSLGYGVGGTLGGLAAAWLCSSIDTSAAFVSSSVAALLGVGAVLQARRFDSGVA
jgi:PPP family 3-phenylpropionic acid transporter